MVREQLGSTATASQDDRRLKQVLARRRSQSEAFFSSSAGQWDRLREDLFGTSHFKALAGLLDADVVLGDLGCGTGTVSQWLSPFCKRIIAVDASKEMLDAARENLRSERNVELRQGSLSRRHRHRSLIGLINWGEASSESGTTRFRAALVRGDDPT